MRVPWTARRPSQSILKEIRPEYSLEGLMLKLKLQYFGRLIRRADSLENILMTGKKGVTEAEKVGWHHQLSGRESEQTPGDSEGREAWFAAVHRVEKSRTRLSEQQLLDRSFLPTFPVQVSD